MFLCYSLCIISHFHIFESCDFIALFQSGSVSVVLRAELTASLELPLWSKRVSGCFVLSFAVSKVGLVSSEAKFSHCFSLRTAKGESKYLYQVDQTLPPLTSRSEHPEDSCMSAWRPSWSWSRTPKSPQLTKAQSRAVKEPTIRAVLENLGIETKHNFAFLNNETCWLSEMYVFAKSIVMQKQGSRINKFHFH